MRKYPQKKSARSARRDSRHRTKVTFNLPCPKHGIHRVNKNKFQDALQREKLECRDIRNRNAVRESELFE